MRILYQFPTRSRVEKFFNTLDIYYNMIADIDNSIFHIVISDDDESMNNDAILVKLSEYKNLTYSVTNEANTKINACNYGVSKFDFDIVVLVSDDMIPQAHGFDYTIRLKMAENFADLDGVLWFFDGYAKFLCTLSILGKKYYDRFNYIYHPDYTSLWCDNEFMEVAKRLNKLKQFEECIIKHEHFVWNKQVENDTLYQKNEAYYRIDEQVYKNRLIKNFDL